ncbi:MAG TPA: tyrosine-type recombinase/integrase, partial [Thermodesulfobacteriota bacterium]|nr:tyrosine-type recombinase/integrase [Thermodesulfobacteriota bacterium]
EKFEEQYLEFSLANKKPRTATRDTVSVKPLQGFFGGKFLSEINPFLIEKYKQKRKEDEVSVRTINIELACLRHMFNMAVKWGKAQKNPVSEVKLFKEPEGKDRILSPEEEIRLLEAARASTKAPHLEPIILTAIKTGMRLSEVLGLKWPNVDFSSRVITVEGTKNGHIRKIPMSPKLTEVLERGRKIAQGEYVFADRAGRPFKGFRRSWDHALKKAGIENLTFHSLRHTFGTRLGMQGTDLGTIQELMGHADLKMTKRYYHPTSAHKREAVEALDRVTTFFTTQGVDRDKSKVVNIGNH